MQPTYASGDLIIAWRTQVLAIGDVVVVKTDDAGLIVKRIASLGSDDVMLVGDNPRLASSCCDRPHMKGAIVGKVMFKLTRSFGVNVSRAVREGS